MTALDTATPARQPRVSDETAISVLSNVHALLSRLRSRSRTEIFYPGSVAPELLRRAEEQFAQIVDCEFPSELRDTRADLATANAEIARLNGLVEQMAECLKLALACEDCDADQWQPEARLILAAQPVPNRRQDDRAAIRAAAKTEEP